MRTLTTRQQELSERRDIQPLALVQLTTYTDRIAKTGAAVHYYASAPISYDYGNTGTNQFFDPYLIDVELQPETITHLPTADARRSEVRPLRMTLRNAQDADGTYLLDELRENENLLFAEIEVSELLLDTNAGETLDTTRQLVGDEHVVFFRGEVVASDGITEDSFSLLCQPQHYGFSPVLISDASSADPLDLGKIIPHVFGTTRRLPLLGWQVGAKTTLSLGLTAGATGLISITDDNTGFTTSGSLEISGERMTYNKTGAATNQLNVTARAQGGTLGAVHAAGESVLEVNDSGIWIACMGPADLMSLGQIVVLNPLNGDLVRINSLVTPTVDLADTTTISGQTVASMTLTAGQIQTLLEGLAQQAAVTQQPDVGHPITSSETQSPTSGQSELRDGNFSTGKLVDNDGGSGNPNSINVTFDTPPTGVGGGTIQSQAIRITVNTELDTGSQNIKVDLGATQILLLDPSSFSGTQTFVIQTTSNTSNVVTIQATGAGADLRFEVFEVERDVVFLQPDPTLDANVAISAASFGYGLRFYADVVGHEVPAADVSYTTAAGNRVAKPPDVFRFLIQEILGLTSAIDETQWAIAETRTAALTRPSFVWPYLGETWDEFIGTLEFYTRSQLIRAETASGTVYRLLAAAVPSAGSYDFGAKVATITEWDEIAETTLDDEHVFTRWRLAHNADLSIGGGYADLNAYREYFECSPDQSDVTGISTTDMDNAEKALGRHDRPFLLVPADETGGATLHVEDLIGYYVQEHKRALILAEIRGAVWVEAYALEVGDIFGAQARWWPAEKKLRAIQVSRRWDTRRVDIVGVEVP